MGTFIRLAVLVMIALGTATQSLAQIKSVYTALSDKACKTIRSEPDDGAEYEGECAGVGGYKLHLLEGDLRQSIDVITPSKKTHQLQFWNISGGFSFVGDRAEWRMKGRIPIALIVRFNVSEDPENTERHTSYLVVTKITKTAICVTDVIKPTRSQNYEARRAADRSADRPCMKRDSP